MYVYIRSQPDLYTVGLYDPDGQWQPESDHPRFEEAANRVAWLNGSSKQIVRPKIDHGWPEWSVSPGHCEHAEDHEVLERVRVCGWKTGLCAGPCPSCPNITPHPSPVHPHSTDLLAALAAQNGRLKSILAHMRKHSGECLGDNPSWMAEIDALLAESETAK